MKPAALAAAFGIVWSLIALGVGTANLRWPDYGVAFLQLLASIYPGYDAARTPGQVAVLAGYSLVDGAILAYAIGWLYVTIEGRASRA